MNTLIGNQRDPAVLADLARGSIRKKTAQLQKILTGHFTDHHAPAGQDDRPGRGDRG